MCAIPQAVSAPLNPLPTVEHFSEEPSTMLAQLLTLYIRNGSKFWFKLETNILNIVSLCQFGV